MSNIFTEDDPIKTQQNFAHLSITLQSHHQSLIQKNNSLSDQNILASIHKMSSETMNELKDMKIQLEKERESNNELNKEILRMKIIENNRRGSGNRVMFSNTNGRRYTSDVNVNHNFDENAALIQDLDKDGDDGFCNSNKCKKNSYSWF